MKSLKARNYYILRHCTELWAEWKEKYSQHVMLESQRRYAKYLIFKPWYDAKKEEKLLLEWKDRLEEFGLKPTLENISLLKKMKYKAG